MEPTHRQAYPDTLRMELRSLVKLAGEVVAPYWPMRTFIHHNPLHELEYLGCDEAVRRGERFLGGRGRLPPAWFRGELRRGRIRPEHLDEALAPLVRDGAVAIGGRQVTQAAVLKAHLVHAIGAPAGEALDRAFESAPDRLLLERLCERLSPGPRPRRPEEWLEEIGREDRAALATGVTLAAWCDRTLGSRVTAAIDDEMIKWCSAFLDEGQAAWAMPERDKTLYGAWKRLAALDASLALLGIADGRRKVAELPARPEDAVLSSLEQMAIPKPLWVEYLSLHLGALPGWVGFIKWRAGQSQHPWQQAYPADPVKYLAIRLFYERELVAAVCARELGIAGDYPAIGQYMEREPHAYALLRERATGRLPPRWARRVARLRFRWRPPRREEWERLARRYCEESEPLRVARALRGDALRLVALAKALDLDPALLPESDRSSLRTLLEWLDAVPESAHGPLWQEAFEAGYRERLLALLAGAARRTEPGQDGSEPARSGAVRPGVQAIFCIDVRSERLRRHLEAVGDCETFGFAGFFAVPLCYRGFADEQETDQCPVLLKPKHLVREVPRSYHGEEAGRHRAGTRLIQAGRELLHDLKLNVITPYVMVEAIGWFFLLPFVGKTLLPLWLRRLGRWAQRRIAPPIATTLTVDKLSNEEAREMLAAEQRAVIRRVLREEQGVAEALLTADLIEQVRLAALEEEPAPAGLERRLAEAGLPASALKDWVADLRGRHRIDARWAAARLDRITRTGFTPAEQAFYVENALRMMGLTRNLARLVLVCGHGSTSDNNPFESALDCGACGGNQGQPNARVLAAMANRAAVRARLAANGIEIPPDTHFVAGRHDTTTDEVELLDLEDVPPTHRKDLLRLMGDLKEAGLRTAQERVRQFPDVRRPLTPREAARHVQRRSADWSQVRPEWGLAGNAAFVVGRRELTRGLDLGGRVFLHSYDPRQDETGRALETIMTAPLVVTEWINMEHYFSTVDNGVYGSGSKVYHNVVGRVGVMFGTQSDLRIGLARQTVLDGDRPFHEPLRLLAVIEAPRERIDRIIGRNEILQHFFHGRWVNLVALEPDEGRFYRYHPRQAWIPLRDAAPAGRGPDRAEAMEWALQKERQR